MRETVPPAVRRGPSRGRAPAKSPELPLPSVPVIGKSLGGRGGALITVFNLELVKSLWDAHDGILHRDIFFTRRFIAQTLVSFRFVALLHTPTVPLDCS